MAKASKCFTGSRQAVGVPTLNRNAYMQLFRTIRNASRCSCGGLLSGIRYHDGKAYRQCHSCGLEYCIQDGAFYIREEICTEKS